MMQAQIDPNTARYAKCIEVSKRIRWDIDKDLIRGRSFDFSKKFLPDGISKVDQLAFLNNEEKRLLSQIQGRTYANPVRSASAALHSLPAYLLAFQYACSFGVELTVFNMAATYFHGERVESSVLRKCMLVKRQQ